jgi:hypothetical protein
MKSGSAEWGGTMILMDNAKRPFQILNTFKKKTWSGFIGPLQGCNPDVHSGKSGA